MRASMVVALAVMGSAPFVSGLGLDWLHAGDVQRVLDGENVTKVASDVATREFTPDMRIELLGARASSTVLGAYGDEMRAPAGDEYLHVTLRLTNAGRLDETVHTFQFGARDAAGVRVRALVGTAEGIEQTRVSTGQSVTGTIVFQLPEGDQLAKLTWEGELGETDVTLS